MVSNYVKKASSAPRQKEVYPEQLASLIYIVVSKTVLPMENIQAPFCHAAGHCTAAEAYDYFWP